MDINDGTDREYHFRKNPRKVYVTGSFPNKPDVPNMRYVSQVTDGDEGWAFVNVEGEQVLRRTPAGRIEIRATVVEETRDVRSVLIQQFSKTDPSAHIHFTFGPQAIGRVLGLFQTIKTMKLESSDKVHLTVEVAVNQLAGFLTTQCLPPFPYDRRAAHTAVCARGQVET